MRSLGIEKPLQTHLDQKQKVFAMLEDLHTTFDIVEREEVLKILKKNQIENEIVNRILKI